MPAVSTTEPDRLRRILTKIIWTETDAGTYWLPRRRVRAEPNECRLHRRRSLASTSSIGFGYLRSPFPQAPSETEAASLWLSRIRSLPEPSFRSSIGDGATHSRSSSDTVPYGGWILKTRRIRSLNISLPFGDGAYTTASGKYQSVIQKGCKQLISYNIIPYKTVLYHYTHTLQKR